PSLEKRIAAVYADHIERLDFEVRETLRSISQDLVHESVSGIPFRILPPEAYAALVFARSDIDRSSALEILKEARSASQPNELLIGSFLRDYQPMLSASVGACVPFDPALADVLVQLYPEYQERIVFNLVASCGAKGMQLRAALASC